MSYHIHLGDCLDVLNTLEAGSVRTCVTSPPYYGLRDYGTAEWEGGDAGCDHTPRRLRHDPRKSRSGAGLTGGKNSVDVSEVIRGDCPCGARRVDRQIGLEATPAEFVARMVEVFRAVRRVLADDGTLWLNLGDSYATNPGNGRQGPSRLDKGGGLPHHSGSDRSALGNKQLLMMPARVALALQDDGWILRSDIIWAKPNPMPESVRDRPTKSHEYVFLLSKKPDYFYDMEAVREPNSSEGQRQHNNRYAREYPQQRAENWHKANTPTAGIHSRVPEAGRNLRTVWNITPRPFSDAHFATFPPELPERCIKAGSSERGKCPECGKPWVRTVEPTPEYAERLKRANDRGDWYPRMDTNAKREDGTKHGKLEGGIQAAYLTTGWRPTCDHDLEPVPDVVLDPFAGAGTTLMVARRLFRDSIGIELNPDYRRMALNRIAEDNPNPLFDWATP